MDQNLMVKKPMENPSNEVFTYDYLKHLKSQNKTQATIHEHRNVLERFLGDLIYPVLVMRSDDILNVFQRDRHQVTDETVNTRLDILTSFFTYCIEKGYMEKSPVDQYNYPRDPFPLNIYLNQERVIKIKLEMGQAPLLNQLLLELMLMSGCRISEAQALNHEDIDLTNRFVYIPGQIPNKVYFTVRFKALIEKFMTSQANQSSALFVNRNGKRLSHRQLQRIVLDIGEKTGIAQQFPVFWMRRRYAKQLLAKGADLSVSTDGCGAGISTFHL